MKKSIIILFLILASCTKEPITDDYVAIPTEFQDVGKVLFDSINAFRFRNGQPPLIGEQTLTNGCITKSHLMWSFKKVNHDGWKARRDNSHAFNFGEVVCGRYVTPQSMFAAYVGSPEHRNDLLRADFTHIGIGITDGYNCIDLASYGNVNGKKQLKPLLTEPLQNQPTTITVFSGTRNPADLVMQCNGYHNGSITMFLFISGIATLPDGTCFVTGDYVPVIQKVALGYSSELSGSAEFVSPYYTGWGYVDGTAENARYNNPKGLCIGADLNIYMADWGNNKIRRITQTGFTTTLTGSTQGFADGNSTTAQFKSINAICPAGNNFYAGDGNRVRFIDSEGNVTTICGSVQGNTIGDISTAKFRDIEGIAFYNNILYVSDAGNNCVKKIDLNTGLVTLVNIPDLILPSGIAVYQGNLFVADETRGVIYKNGNVWAEGLLCPKQISFDTQGNCYVANRNGHNILKITE